MAESSDRYGPTGHQSGETVSESVENQMPAPSDRRPWFEGRCANCSNVGECTYYNGEATCTDCFLEGRR